MSGTPTGRHAASDAWRPRAASSRSALPSLSVRRASDRAVAPEDAGRVGRALTWRSRARAGAVKVEPRSDSAPRKLKNVRPLRCSPSAARTSPNAASIASGMPGATGTPRQNTEYSSVIAPLGPSSAVARASAPPRCRICTTARGMSASAPAASTSRSSVASSRVWSSSEYSWVGIGSTGSAAIPPSWDSGTTATVSMTWAGSWRSRLSNLLASVSEPRKVTSTETKARPRRSSGSSGIGGNRNRCAHRVSSSGASAVIWRNARSTGRAISSGHSIRPPTTGPTSSSMSSTARTTPKSPPPPHIAQNRSGSLAGEIRRRTPAASTISKRDDAVRGQPESTAEPAEPAAEREPDDARVGAAARQGRQPGRLQRGEEGAPLDPGADPGHASLDVDVDVLERTGAQQDGAAEGGRRAVTDRLGRDAEAVPGGARDDGDHVLRVVHGDHGGRVLVDVDGPAQAGPVPAGALRQEDPARQESVQLAQGGAGRRVRRGRRVRAGEVSRSVMAVPFG